MRSENEEQKSQKQGVRWNLFDHVVQRRQNSRNTGPTQHGYGHNTLAAEQRRDQPPARRDEEMRDITPEETQPTIPIIATPEQGANYEMLKNWQISQSDAVPGLVHICLLLRTISDWQKMSEQKYNDISSLLNAGLKPTTQFHAIVEYLIKNGILNDLPDLSAIEIGPELMEQLPRIPSSNLINGKLNSYCEKIKTWTDKHNYEKLVKSSMHIATLFHALSLEKMHKNTPHAMHAQQLLKLIMETIYQYDHYNIFFNRAPANFRLLLLALTNNLLNRRTTDAQATFSNLHQQIELKQKPNEEASSIKQSDRLIEQALARINTFFSVRARKFLNGKKPIKEVQYEFPLEEFDIEAAQNLTARTLFEIEAAKLAFFIGCDENIGNMYAAVSFAACAISLYDANSRKHNDHIGRNITNGLLIIYNKMNDFYTFTSWLGATIWIIKHAILIIIIIDYAGRKGKNQSFI